MNGQTGTVGRHAATPATMTDWGSWALGDLTDPLRAAIELLGPDAAVVSATLVLPRGSVVVPEVRVKVDTRRQVEQLRREVEAGEFVTVYDDVQPFNGWSCSVAGIHLTVTTEVKAL